MTKKIPYITLSIVFILLVSIVGLTSQQVDAKSKQNNSRCSHTCGPYSISKGGYTYSVSVGANYFCRIGWPSWGCGLLKSEALARITPNRLSSSWGEGCGNIHSFSGKIIGYPTVNNYSTGTINLGGTGTATTTSTTTRYVPVAECIRGVNCPETDFGAIISQALVTPAYAGASKTCPLYWDVTAEAEGQSTTCVLSVNGKDPVDVPKSTPDKVKGYPIPVGSAILTCTRHDDNSTTTVSKTISCKNNPMVHEI